MNRRANRAWPAEVRPVLAVVHQCIDQGVTSTFSYRGAGQSERTTAGPGVRTGDGEPLCTIATGCTDPPVSQTSTSTFLHSRLGVTAETVLADDDATTIASDGPSSLAPRVVLYTAVGTAFLILPMFASVGLIWQSLSVAVALVFQVAAARGLWGWYRDYVDQHSRSGQE